jgi:transcriptional regulator with XRE-family HTH domain
MTGTDLRHILSKNIKTLRIKRSLSQIELAEKADISIPFLSHIERNNKWPHPDTLVKLAKALDVEVYTLFQNSGHSLPDKERRILEQFKKDIATSIHKSVKTAIDSSIETIGERYLGSDDGKTPRP